MAAVELTATELGVLEQASRGRNIEETASEAPPESEHGEVAEVEPDLPEARSQEHDARGRDRAARGPDRVMVENRAFAPAPLNDAARRSFSTGASTAAGADRTSAAASCAPSARRPRASRVAC